MALKFFSIVIILLLPLVEVFASGGSSERDVGRRDYTLGSVVRIDPLMSNLSDCLSALGLGDGYHFGNRLGEKYLTFQFNEAYLLDPMKENPNLYMLPVAYTTGKRQAIDGRTGDWVNVVVDESTPNPRPIKYNELLKILRENFENLKFRKAEVQTRNLNAYLQSQPAFHRKKAKIYGLTQPSNEEMCKISPDKLKEFRKTQMQEVAISINGNRRRRANLKKCHSHGIAPLREEAERKMQEYRKEMSVLAEYENLYSSDIEEVRKGCHGGRGRQPAEPEPDLFRSRG